MSTHNPDRLAAPQRHVIPAEGLHLSLEDIFENTPSPTVDHASKLPSPTPPPRSGAMSESPIPTNPPDRAPPGLFDSGFALSSQNAIFELHDGHEPNLNSSLIESSPSSSSTCGSSPLSTTSFEFSTHSARTTEREHGAGTSFDTTLTTPSPTASISQNSKGKQRAILSEFDRETDTETESSELGKDFGSCLFQHESQCDAGNDSEIVQAGVSNWHGAVATRDIGPPLTNLESQRETISSGISLAMAYSKQRADPPKPAFSPGASTSSNMVPSIVNVASRRLRQRTNSSPSPADSGAPENITLNTRPLTFVDGGGHHSSRDVDTLHSPSGTRNSRPSHPKLGRSVSMSFKLKLRRSDFIRSSGKTSPAVNQTLNWRGPVSNAEEELLSSLSSPKPAVASHNASSESLRGAALRKKGILVRPHTTPPYGDSITNLRSSTVPPVLTNESAESTAEYTTPDSELVDEKRDLFDEAIPVEIRLYIFSTLVRLHVDEHQGLIDAGMWTTAPACRTRWVGWEGGVRELVKLSRVSRAWQALVFDGQLWPTLGGCPALPPSLLVRISASAGAFVHSLQLEGATTLTAEDIVMITSRVSVIPHHTQSIQLHASVPIDHWCTNVKSINLAGCYGVTTRALHKLLASCPLLESLCLRGLSAVTNTTCIVIGDAHPQLVSLDLSHCSSLDAFGMTFICEAVDRRRLVLDITSPLKELRLSGLKRISELTLASLARVFPALQVLDLSYCTSLVDACLERFTEWQEDDVPVSAAEMRRRYQGSPTEHLTSFTELTALQIGLDPTDRTVYKRRVTRLRHLNVSHCTSLTDQACTHLAYAVPLLELLELAGIGAGLEDAGIVRLLKSTPLIRKLDLEDASRITDDVITALVPPAPPPGSQRLTPITIPGQIVRATSYASRPVQTGERLEHLIVSYAGLLTPEALGTLVRSCPKLHTFEADNTRLSDSNVREFVELQRTRGARESALVAIDCASVGRVLVDELASKGLTRPRAGWRGWHARKLGYADAGDGDDASGSWGSGLDECDDRRVTLKSFRSWQVVDRWAQERMKRKNNPDACGSPSRTSKSGSRWFGRRSNPGSGANTPGSVTDDDERGCIVM